MATNVNNVTTGKPRVGGAIWRAPLGTALPTDASSALAQAYISMGYCSEDGLKNNNSMEGDSVKAWGGDVVLRYQTGKTDEFSFTLLEATNTDVLAAVHGSSNVSGALETGISVTANAKEPEEAVWVADMILRNGALKRIVIPDGKITAVGEVVYSDSAAVGYAITLTALPDASGNTHYEYIKAKTVQAPPAGNVQDEN